MQLKRSYVYQVAAIALLVIASMCLRGIWYEWETELGRISSHEMQNPFGIYDLSKDGLYKLISWYADGYRNEETIASLRKLLLILKASPIVVAMDYIAIAAVILRLKPAWGIFAALTHGIHIFFLGEYEMRELVLHMYECFMGSGDKLVISYQLYAGVTCAMLSVLVYTICYEKFNFKGTPFFKHGLSSDTETTFCRHCGAKNKAGSRFCVKCGEKIERDDMRQS